MRYPEPSNIATLQELSGGEWVAYSRDFGEVKSLVSLDVEILGLCDGKRSESDIVRESGKSAEDVSRSLDLLTAYRLLVNEDLPEIVPGMVGAQVGEELVIYDQKTSAAHKLSATLARVYNACVGRESRDTLKAELSLAGGNGSEALSGAVLELEAAGLVQVRPNNVARRTFLSTGMKAAAAVGIASVLAPTAAHAAASSCTGCVIATGCVSGNCGSCCNSSGTNCNGRRTCINYFYAFSSPDNLNSADFGDCSLNDTLFYTNCDDICDDLVLNDGGIYGCCNSGGNTADVPPPNQAIGQNCIICGFGDRQLCGDNDGPGVTITCCSSSGLCGRTNGSTCTTNGQCCSNNCDGGTNTCQP